MPGRASEAQQSCTADADTALGMRLGTRAQRATSAAEHAQHGVARRRTRTQHRTSHSHPSHAPAHSPDAGLATRTDTDPTWTQLSAHAIAAVDERSRTWTAARARTHRAHIAAHAPTSHHPLHADHPDRPQHLHAEADRARCCSWSSAGSTRDAQRSSTTQRPHHCARRPTPASLACSRQAGRLRQRRETRF